MPDEETNTVRERIVDRHKQVMQHENMAGLMLATAVILATFGTAAVLMPDEPTGAFSGDFKIGNVDVKDVNIRGVETSSTGITFVQDYEIENPNILQAEFKTASYRISIEGESVDTGYINGKTLIDSEQTEMIAMAHETALSEIYTGSTPVTIEGKMLFQIGNTEFERYYRNSFEAEFPVK